MGAKLLSIVPLVMAGYALPAQPIAEIYLNSQIPASRGANFYQVEEVHEVLAVQNGTSPTFKITKRFDKNGKVVLETKRNSAGGMQYETSWNYNARGEPVRRFTRQFINYKGWVTEEVLIKYNDTTGCLQEMTFFYEKAKKQYVQASCDSLGRLRELRIFNDAGVFTSIERLLYVPANNSLRVMVYRSNEQYIATYTYPLDHTKPPPKSAVQRAYNDRGDIILEALPNSKLKQGYYYDYRYDSYGNWNLRLTYQCTVGSNDRIRNKKLEYKVTRNITY